MFDDPNRELRRMQEELLAMERQEQNPAVDDDWLQEAKALLGPEEEEFPIRNHANGYGTRPFPDPTADSRMAYVPDPTEDSRMAYAGAPREDPADKQSKPKGAGGLILLALLEVAGILAVALWWARWLS